MGKVEVGSKWVGPIVSICGKESMGGAGGGEAQGRVRVREGGSSYGGEQK